MKMAQIKLYLANTIFVIEINDKWHNLNEKWHKLNYIWQTQYFQPKSMKNGTIQIIFGRRNIFNQNQ